MTTKKPIKTEDLKISQRVYKQLSDESMSSLWEAIVEFITNVDDSYERLAKLVNNKKWHGKCLLEYSPGGKSNPTIMNVKDQAEGMDFETLKKCFRTYGDKQSGTASRGIAGRGAKDAASIGDVWVSTIKNGNFSQIKIDNKSRKFETYNVDDKCTNEHYKSIGIKKGKNGTSIKLEISPKKEGYHLRAGDLAKKIPLHYALSEILHINRKTLELKYKSNKHDLTLSFREPDGELIEERTFLVNKYNSYGESAKVNFKLFKSKVPLDGGEGDKRFRQWGISIIGKKAVHEKSLLDASYDVAPEGKFYYGYLKSDLITDLLNEYDNRQNKGKSPLADNPRPIIDLKRIDGLRRDHPATEEIFRIPKEIIKKNILQDRSSSQDKYIENETTRETLDELARECAKLMEDLYEEDETNIQGINIDANQWKFIPPKQKIYTGEKKSIYAYTIKKNLSANLDTAYIKVSKGNEENIIIHKDKTKFKESKKVKGLIFFKFEIEGSLPGENININVFQKEGKIRTVLALDILAEKPRSFINELEFEKETYNIRTNRLKRLKIFAKMPNVFNNKLSESEKIAKIITVNSNNIRIIGKCKFAISGSNYAIGYLQVEGRTLSAENEITIQLNGKRASTYINVLNKEEKNDDDDKSKFNFNILPTKYGKRRYSWNPNNPNTLEIAGEHDQLKRYLGKKENGYPGQEASCFKSLLAEIVTDAMIEKRMTLNSRYDPGGYNSLIEKTNIQDTINNFLIQIDEEKSIFLDRIHKILLKDSVINDEIRKIASKKL